MTESLSIAAIEGDPERTIFLVVTPDEVLCEEHCHQVAKATNLLLQGTKWEGIPILVSRPGWKLEAVELTRKQAAAMQAKQETWRDKEAML